MSFVMVVALVACRGAAVDYSVDGNTLGTPTACVSARIDDIRQTGISSHSVSGPNTRALARTAGGEVVQWDFMRSLHTASRLAVDDEVVLLLGADGRPVGMTRTCPPGVASGG